MKTTFVLLTILFSVCNPARVPASGITENPKIDSLQKLLATARHDTDRIKLHYFIAFESKMDSVPLWEKLRAEMHNHRMVFYEIKTINRIGILFSHRGNTLKAGAMYEEALEVAEEGGTTEDVIKQLKALHDFYFVQLDRKKTSYFILKGMKVAEKAGNQVALADFYSMLAMHYTTMGDLNKSLKMHFQALKRYRELNYEWGIASSLLDIGSTYSALDQNEKAIPYYLESKKYVHAMESMYVVQIYCAVGDAFRYQKKYDSAEFYLDKAHTLAKEINMPGAIIGALVVKGWLADARGNTQEALKYAFEAKEMVDSIGYTLQLPTLYLLFKSIYTHEGNYKKALESYESYIGIRDSLSDEKTRKQAAEQEYEYNLEKKENANKLLAQQNEIQHLELKQDKYIYAGMGIAVLILSVTVYLFIRQRRYKADHLRIQLEQKLLRAQMNPHFVFNSLNSIQQFVMEERNDKAELYLFKFSTLMRDLLESNIKDSLTVTEEITMLNAYLEMEALRFGSRFDYALLVDERINQDKANIPHLMIQPFVENAIWHGLLPKNGDRTLQINIGYDTDKTIRCVIDDNGIGREASQKRESTFRKKSLALSFVNQRIALIKQTYGIEGRVSIIDKKDEDGNSTGTTVILILPIFKN